MLKNQGFIYISPCQLANAPLVKINYDPRANLPAGFMETNNALALWPLAGQTLSGHELVDQLHASLISMGLAFTIPKVYQTQFSQLMKYIDNWLAVDRHFEGNDILTNDLLKNLPLKVNYIEESSMNLKQLGDFWITHDPCYEQTAAAAFYRGMYHGQDDCKIQLARCYEEGVGVEINYVKAKELLLSVPTNDKTFPLLFRLGYKEKSPEAIHDLKNKFFMKSPLPLPGKGHQFDVFHQNLLELLFISYEEAGHLDIWLGSWELVSPYRDELLALSEVMVMDFFDTPEASQMRSFHDILSHMFESYRYSA